MPMNGALISRGVVVLVVVLAECGIAGMAQAAQPAILFTADTQGHVWPGDCCSGSAGQGCLPRRATVVANARLAAGDLLLVDAGNALFGTGSAASKGKVIVAGYNAMGYDAVNVSHRDFRFGKAVTVEALKDAKFTPISANIVDEATGRPLLRPFIVKRIGDANTAVVGVTDLSPALAQLPHLRQQLAGLNILPVADALAEVLPKARQEAQRVVLLYYGTPEGLNAVRAKFAGQLTMILVGGVRPDVVPADETLILAATAEFGQQVAQLTAGDGPKMQLAQLTVDAKTPVDEPTKKLLLPYVSKPKPSDAAPIAAGPAATVPAGSPTPAAPATTAALPAGVLTSAVLRSGPVQSTAVGQSKALVLKVKQIELSSGVGEVKPSADGVLAVLETEWTNRLEMAQEVPDLAAHVYLVANGRRLACLHAQASDVKGHLPTDRLEFPDRGSVVKGKLAFDVPVKDIASLELRYLDTTGGNIVLPLVAGKSADAANPLAGPLKNQAVEVSVYSIKKVDAWAGRKAPAGMTFAVVDLCVKSVTKSDDTHFDLAQMPEWRRYTCLIVDGRYAQVPQSGGIWEEKLLAIPEVATGGPVVFLVPQQLTSLELRMDFPSLDTDDSSAAIVLPLEGKAKAAAAPKPIASVKDDIFKVDFTGQHVVESIDDNYADQDRKFLLLDVSVANSGRSGQWFQPAKQIQYPAGKDENLQMDEVTQRCVHGCSAEVWVPAGQSRSFQVVFQVPASDTKAQLSFIGADAQQKIVLEAMSRPAVKTPAPAAVVRVPAPASEPASAGSSLAAVAPVPGATPVANVAQATTQKLPRVIPTVKVGDTVVFDPTLAPKGLAGVGLTQAQVDKAVLNGRKYLWEAIKGSLWGEQEWFTDREQILACLAMAHSGAGADIPGFSAAVKKTLFHANTNELNDTYLAGVLAMLVEGSGDEDCRAVLNVVTRYLVEAQGPEGTWTYSGDYGAMRELLAKAVVMPAPAASGSSFKVTGGRPIESASRATFNRTSPAGVGADGDNSASQFAVLGLWTASRAGLGIDKDIWKRCLATTRKRQQSDGSLGYGDDGGYGSMTCAFICTSAIAESYLGSDPFQDRAIHRALAWLVKHWSVKENPEHSEQHYYYLYSLERVGRCLDIDFIGDKEWFPLGARFLVDKQHADGGWGEKDESNILDTSFALLFLTKATATLTPAPRGGTGVLLTEGPSIRADRIYFILDASTSMYNEIGQKSKFQIAQESLQAIANALPDQTQVALRVYGNHFSDHPRGADEDSTLEIPLGKLDKKAFAQKLQSLYARGKTPLAYSMEQAAADLKNARVSASSPVAVVLLTDGWESTAKNRDPVAAAKALGAVEGTMLNVVALDVSADEEAKQLQAIAKAANGEYWPASDADKLITHLRKAVMAMPGRFVVLDSAGSKVADGLYGQAITLKEGKYVLRATLDGNEVEQPFWINTGHTTRVVYEAPKSSAKKTKNPS